jgi:putative heme-binding domain-containing protein
MTIRTPFVAAATLFTTVALVAAFGVRSSASQDAPEAPMPGSKMTRQQIVDKLASDAPGTTVSVEKGKALYEELCAGCHIFGETGTSVGPDLTTLASRFGRREILDSILWPSRTISDQYGVTVFEMTDGSFESGVIIRETGNAVAIKNADNLDRPRVIALAQVKERTESTVSLMPEGLVANLSLDDIDSLVTYVRGGK